MPEPLLNVLKLCVLALLYLFFLRVLRAVWSEINGPRAAVAPARPVRTPRRERRATARGRNGAHLAVLEPANLKGRTYDLSEEVTVGRASGCQITLDDNYVSQLHARVFLADGVPHVEDLGSTNGTYLNANKVSAPMAMKRGDRLKIGATVMEVRT